MKIICISKTTPYEDHHKTFRILPTFIQKRFEKGYNNHHKSYEKLRRVVVKLGLDVTFVKDKDIHKINWSEYDLAFALGGDGTFLTLAHYTTLPILGINSNPHQKRGSIGALLTSSITHIERDLQKIKKGLFTIQSWPVLKASVNGKKLKQHAINEIYFGPIEQDKTCEFELHVGKEKELFQCSGLIMSTKKGSHAWYRNAGGKLFSSSKKFGYVVREPNLLYKPVMTRGVLEQLKFEVGGCDTFLSFDSRRESRYNLGCTKGVVEVALKKDGVKIVNLQSP